MSAGLAMCDAAPDLLEFLTDIAMGDLDRVETQIALFLEELLTTRCATI